METSTTVVTGASRGFGRALATALVQRGRHVVGVARDAHDLGCSGSIARARSCWLPAPCRRCGRSTC